MLMDRRKTIGIIGGGATGVSLLAQLVAELGRSNQASETEIYLFEKDDKIGKGLAYGTSYKSSILNMSASLMSPYSQSPRLFIEWLYAKDLISREQMENEAIHASLYLPRRLFGEFLSDLVFDILAKARQMNLRISIVRDEVTDLNENQSQKKYFIHTALEHIYAADVVVLATGHLRSTGLPHLKGEQHFYQSPYPEDRLYSIPSTATVGIIGTRLSAIDAVLALEANGHCGKYIMVSRTGRLPAVRSLSNNQVGICPQFERLLRKNSAITCLDLLRALKTELSNYCGSSVYISALLGSNLTPEENLIRDIAATCEHRTEWQDILLALDSYVEEIWARMDEPSKQTFEHLYRSAWSCLRHPMPLANAVKLKSLCESKRLTIRAGFEGVDKSQNGFIIRYVKAPSSTVNAVIDGTGPGFDATRSNSPLFNRMLRRGDIVSHQFGGFIVDRKTSKVIRSDKSVHALLFAVGPQTRGVHFYTNALDRNALHAHRVVQQIISVLEQSMVPETEFTRPYDPTTYAYKEAV